jgi:hypothetical protein
VDSRATAEGGTADGGRDASDATSDSGERDSGDAGTADAKHDAAPACVVTNPDLDMDGDGWSPNEGDCNDCNPYVNPGAVDFPQAIGPDGGLLPGVDYDCSGTFDPPTPCDQGLALDDVDANDGAKAIELCQTTTANPPLPQKTWGVISAQYVRANGVTYANPGDQVGIESAWGPNVAVRAGANMLVLSSGHARTSAQPEACGSNSCVDEGEGTAPPGFPQDNPSCPPSEDIYDDVALEVSLRVPTNASGYSFGLKFYSMEYPYWVCDSYNDQFIALVNPAPTGSINGNISFDSLHNPVSVNLGFFSVCDPTQVSQYAFDCQSNLGTCQSPPNPYCPSGTLQLSGTGFDIWDEAYGGAGATDWLVTQAPTPATPGSVITIRFAIWDTGDDNFDSTVLLDGFKWIQNPVSVSTGLM